ncbi:hypothetical protein ABZ532_25555 [Streptomyces sp. NPDC019396]|uniref:hypothetical protein n=1 Tax=Streptomyces sp. NPDC019396 TaxID=3154687 RepID=UPI0033F5C360
MNADPRHDDALTIYLNDHLAGATTGVELSRRIARAHRASPRAADMERIADDIAEDRASLVALMRSLGIGPRRYKVCVGWAVEKIARLKPNGRLHRRAGLSSLVELETLRIGIQGKYELWQSLATVAEERPRIDYGRIIELKDRARRQMEIVDELHNESAEVLR